MTRTMPSTLIAVGFVGAVAGFLAQVALASLSLPRLRPEYTLITTLVLVGVVLALALRVSPPSGTKRCSTTPSIPRT